jgi:hypothetical protein
MFFLIYSISACANHTEKINDLKIAREYTEGLLEIPSDMIIFLEILATINCYACECPVLEQPLPSYIYTPNILRIRVLNELVLDKSTDISTLLSSTKILIGTKGLLGNQLYLTDIDSFEKLPLELEQEEKMFSVYSADRNGVIVAGTDDGIYFIEPGQTWYSKPVIGSGEPDDCYSKIIYGFANHGLIDKNSIQYLDENELALKPVY